MATYCFCKEHGMFEGKQCPKCKPSVVKRSKKYGGKAVIIPPNMRAQ